MARPARPVVLLVLLEFASGFLQGGFPVLLPGLADRLHLAAGDQSLATGVEFLVSGMAVPLTSRLGDLFGHRRWLRVTLALAGAGYLLTALAGSLPLLLAARMLAGFLSCWLPLEFALVRDQVGEERSGRVIGLLVGALTFGSIVGAVACGAAGTAGPALRALLWALAALPVLGLVLTWSGVPESRVRAAGRADWLGAALLALGLSLLFACLGGLRLGAAGTAAALAAGLLLLVLFVRRERRCAAPLVDVRVLAGRSTAPVFVLSFLLGCVLYGAQAPTRSFQAAVPAVAGYGLAAGSGLLGLLTLPSVLGALLGAVAADRVGRRIGARPALAGAFGLAALGYGAIAVRHGSVAAFVPTGLAAGFGAGIGLALLPAELILRLPAEQTGIGTGVYNTLKTLAGAAAGAAAAAALDAAVLRGGVPDERAYVAIWACCALLAAGGVPVALLLRGTRTRASQPAVV